MNLTGQQIVDNYASTDGGTRKVLLKNLSRLCKNNQNLCGQVVMKGMELNSFSLTMKGCLLYLKYHDQKNMRALHEMAKCRLYSGDLERTKSILRKMVQIHPQHAYTLHLQSLVNFYSGSFALSVDFARQALANLSPNQQAVDFDISQCRMALSEALRAAGDLRAGWETYDARIHNWNGFKAISAHEWCGEDLANKHLFVYQEQGLADHIRFASMLDELRSLCRRLTVTVPGKLITLFKTSFPTVEFIRVEQIEQINALLAAGNFDYQCPMFKVATYLRTSIPFQDSSTIFKREWRDEDFGKEAAAIKIGIFWRSGTSDYRRKRESTNLMEHWRNVLATPNVTFYSLQYNDVVGEITDVKNRTGVEIVNPAFDQFNDIDRLAGFLSGLDLVIGIPGFPVKLAQYCGTETWEIRPNDPGICERAWQRSATLFCKKFEDDWQGLFQAVDERLKRLVNQRISQMPRNALCYCGSEIRFKHCHGQ